MSLSSVVVPSHLEGYQGHINRDEVVWEGDTEESMGLPILPLRSHTCHNGMPSYPLTSSHFLWVPLALQPGQVAFDPPLHSLSARGGMPLGVRQGHSSKRFHVKTKRSLLCRDVAKKQ